MLEIKNLSKKYYDKVVLSDINISFCPGEIVGIFGENGAGKTTLIKSILNLTKYEGEITVDGKKISHEEMGRFSFATSEHSFFPNLTAKAHAEFYKEHFSEFSYKRFDTLMRFFELPYDKKLRTFSSGQKNQFEVIMALSQGAEYIFMDEPFTGNDVFNREDFYKVLVGILEEDETVIISTHLIEEIQNYISRAVFINNGKIIGDINTEDIEKSLVDYIKIIYDYNSDKAVKTVREITGEER